MFLSSVYTGLEEPILKRKRRPTTGLTYARTSRVPFYKNDEAVLPIPPVIAAYNKKINVVDIADQFRVNITLDRRFRRGAI